MTPKAKENLNKMNELGINIKHHDYDSCVEILLSKYIEVSMACEFNEQDRLRLELKRIQKPTN